MGDCLDLSTNTSSAETLAYFALDATFLKIVPETKELIKRKRRTKISRFNILEILSELIRSFHVLFVIKG